MQISIHEVSSAKWPFDRDAEYYARQGVHAMGVLRSKIEAYGVERGVRLLKDT